MKIYPQSFVIVDDKIVFATELSKTEILSFYALSSNILDYVRFGVTQLQCQIDKIGVNDKVTNGNGLFKLNTNFFCSNFVRLKKKPFNLKKEKNSKFVHK